MIITNVIVTILRASGRVLKRGVKSIFSIPGVIIRGGFAIYVGCTVQTFALFIVGSVVIEATQTFVRFSGLQTQLSNLYLAGGITSLAVGLLLVVSNRSTAFRIGVVLAALTFAWILIFAM